MISPVHVMHVSAGEISSLEAEIKQRFDVAKKMEKLCDFLIDLIDVKSVIKSHCIHHGCYVRLVLHNIMQ